MDDSRDADDRSSVTIQPFGTNPVGARGAAEVAKGYLQHFTRRTSCPNGHA
jgi:hypothetical protein